MPVKNNENCPICNGVNLKKAGQVRIYPLALPKDSSPQRLLKKCEDCGSVVASPMPAIDELQQYYDNYYIDDTTHTSESGWQKRTALKTIFETSGKLKKGRVLDIGCTDGSLLDFLGSSFEKYGIEVSQDACLKAKEKGINVYCGSFMESQFDTKFDFIIALDIVEHLPDPGVALHKMIGLLLPGGYIVFQTGNADSLFARLLGEDWYYMAFFGHLYALTPTAVRKVLADEPIEEISIKYSPHIIKNPFSIFFYSLCAYCFHILKIFGKVIPKRILKIGLANKIFNHEPIDTYSYDHFIYIGRKRK
jgi:SAM-dependent methyltransferase